MTTKLQQRIGKPGRSSPAGDEPEIKTLRSAPLKGATNETSILLTPWGRVDSTNGSFVVDEESVSLVAEALAGHGTDLPIDYEHQTLGGTFASPTGQAPAAGWIKRIVGQSGVGLLADIEWTEQAAEMLQAKQYRYLSPVALIRKSDRKLIAIHSAALTNKPAIVGMAPIVNSESSIDPEDEVDELTVLRTELSLPADADVEEVLLVAGRRIAELNQSARARYVQQRVREAVDAGKLVEAQRAWAEALVAREEDLFDEWLKTAPIVVAPGKSAPPSGATLMARRRRTAERIARNEYRQSPMLARLTSEHAYIANATRIDERQSSHLA